MGSSWVAIRSKAWWTPFSFLGVHACQPLLLALESGFTVPVPFSLFSP